MLPAEKAPRPAYREAGAQSKKCRTGAIARSVGQRPQPALVGLGSGRAGRFSVQKVHGNDLARQEPGRIEPPRLRLAKA